MTFRPNPKTYRERLKRNSVAWRKRVIEVFERDGYTCTMCGRLLPFEMLAPCHIKSVGAGGGDEADNIKTGCVPCHDDAHRGLIDIKK